VELIHLYNWQDSFSKFRVSNFKFQFRNNTELICETDDFEKFCTLLATLHRRALPLNPRLNNVAGATHAGCNRDRIGGAILGAGTAFHAPIVITYFGFTVVQRKYPMGAYDGAHSATLAAFSIEFQCRYTG
jgi:hypothetical protein